MDRRSRSILISLVAVLVLTGLIITASLLVPFDVEQHASLRAITGTVEQPGSDPDMLHPGQHLEVAPGGAATVLFFNQGRALVTGPASLTLLESHRRATVLGHALSVDSFERDYVLTVEQTTGRVRYLFANTTPPIKNVRLSILLPNGSYTPTTPCWEIAITVEGHVTTQAIDCPG